MRLRVREPIVVNAQIHTLGGFSAHAGQTGLLEWVAPLQKSRPRVLLTHGEDPQRRGLGAALRHYFGLRSSRPVFRETVTV